MQITDFGLVRAVDDASLTQTGVIAGTPEYMSPEQASGRVIDERSDLFSLGAVMYAACTGHSPFRAGSSLGVLRRITDDQPRPIREINEAVPEWLEAFILKLLAKSPDDRFESADQVAKILKKCLAHAQHPTSIELPEEINKLVPDRQSQMLRVWGWAGAAAAIALATFLFGNMFWNGEPSKTIPTSKTRSEFSTASKKVPSPVDDESKNANQVEQVSQMRSEHFLPATTDIWVSVSDVKRLNERFWATQLGNLFNKNLVAANALSRRASFKTVMDRSFIPGTESHIRWFVDPHRFRSILGQLFGDEEDAIHNSGILESHGFDVFSGVGGCLSFNALDHEMLHRMFVCTSVNGDEESKRRQRSVLEIFNFDNQNIVPLHPPKWVPRNAACCLVANWNPKSAFSNIGRIYDTFLSPGDFARTVADFKSEPSMQVDLENLVNSMGHRVVHYAYSLHPMEPTATNRE